MLRFALCLFLAAIATCQQFNPFCQSWCNGQQSMNYPHTCGTYCGGSYDPCSGYPPPFSGYPSAPGIPVDVFFPGAATGPSFGPAPVGPSFPGVATGPSFGPGPVGPSFPGAGNAWPSWPAVPVGTDPLRVTVYTAPTKPQEWTCPVDPQPRAGPISGNLPPKLVACEYDENCEMVPVRQKCCFDQGVADKVCKPAVPA